MPVARSWKGSGDMDKGGGPGAWRRKGSLLEEGLGHGEKAGSGILLYELAEDLF